MIEITLPAIFQDGMVIQREKEIRIWGHIKGKDGKVTVSLFNSKNELVQSGEGLTEEDGSFKVFLLPQPAGRGFHMEIHAENGLEDAIHQIDNISLGDVWIAGGQSNMEYFLRYDAHWCETCQLPKNSDIHMFNVPRAAFEGHERDFSDSNHWFMEGDYAFESFSAPGYYFARKLQPEIGVPIGIVGCNWGGTPTAAWVSEKYLQKEPMNVRVKEYEASVSQWTEEGMREHCMNYWKQEDNPKWQFAWRCMMYGLSLEDQEKWMEAYKDDLILPMGPYHHYRPAGLYHQMIEKIAPMSVKGVIWYQGESDADHGEVYDKMMADVIDCWKEAFMQKELPFYMVQLAPFGKWLECTGDGYAMVRQRQDELAKSREDVHMISIMDIGMYEDIHPKEKREVGYRLANQALHYTYGLENPCESPEFSGATRKGETVVLTFENCYDGLSVEEEAEGLGGLCILQGEKEIDVDAFSVRGNKLSLHIFAEEALPLQISFGQMNYCKVNLKNSAGLPVKPFECLL